MISQILRAAGLGLVLAVGAGTSTPVAAQSGFEQVINAPGELERLRKRQAELFQQLLDQPDNLDLMFEYATISIRLEDYEAAISTLERMLIYRQDLPRVRLELAVAYFNLGSYEAADLYFDQVLADASTPENVRIRIDRYKEAIRFRTRKSAFTGTLNVGLTYATNATLGPDDGQVLAIVTCGKAVDHFRLLFVKPRVPNARSAQ